MSGFRKLFLCMTGDLFGVIEFCVLLLNQPALVFAGTEVCPKDSSLYTERSVPIASS